MTTNAWPVRTAARERTRAALLEAAVELGSELGYRASRLEAVAERAGVTTGAIYSIFGGKRELFLSAFQQINALPRLEAVAPLGTPLRDVLHGYGLRCAELVTGPRSEGSYWVSLELALESRGHPELDDQLRAGLNASLAVLAAELKAYADAAGEALPMPAKRFVWLLLGALGGLAILRVQTGQPDNAAFGYTAAALLGGTRLRPARWPQDARQGRNPAALG